MLLSHLIKSLEWPYHTNHNLHTSSLTVTQITHYPVDIYAQNLNKIIKNLRLRKL